MKILLKKVSDFRYEETIENVDINILNNIMTNSGYDIIVSQDTEPGYDLTVTIYDGYNE